MLARACWYWNMPAFNTVVAPLAFSSAGLFGKGGKMGGNPWLGGGRWVVVAAAEVGKTKNDRMTVRGKWGRQRRHSGERERENFR